MQDDDLDAAMAGLGEPPPPAETVAASDASTSVDGRVPLRMGSPPPRLAMAVGGVAHEDTIGARLGPWNGRQAFDDLFVSDAAPAPIGRGGLEEKVSYFRDKVKRLDEQFLRFRRAWIVREGELDHLEALFGQTQQQLVTREQALAHSEHARVALVAELGQAASAHTALQDTLRQAEARAHAEQGALAQELARQKEQAAAAHSQHEGLAAGLARELTDARKASRDQLEQQHVQARTAEEAAAAAARRATDLLERTSDLQHELDERTRQLDDTRRALEHDIAVRDEGLAKLRAALDKQRHTLDERSAALEAVQASLAEAQDAAQAQQARLAEASTRHAQDGRQIETQAEALRAAQRVHADLEARWQGGQRECAALQEVLQAAQTQVDDQAAQLVQARGDAQRLSMGAQQAAQELAARDGQLTRLQADHQAQTDQLVAREAQLAEQQAQLGEQREALQKEQTQRALLGGEVEQLQIILTAAQNDLADSDAHAREQLGELQAAVAARDEAIGKLKHAVEAGRARTAQMQGQLTQTEDRAAQAVAALERERQRVNATLTQARAALERARHIMDEGER